LLLLLVRAFSLVGPIKSDFDTIVNCCGWLSMMAAPKLWAALPRIPPKTFLLKLMDSFVPYAYSNRYTQYIPDGETRMDTSQRGPAATRLRELLEQWEPPQMTPEILEAARLLLLADGGKEPPCGWDEYEAEPDCPVEEMIIWPENA
jgi:hypothetical protein